jgi:hypothetical protein
MAQPEKGGAPRVRGEVNDICFDDNNMCHIVHAVLNSSTYYQFFCTYTDTRHINPSDVSEFPLDLTSFSTNIKYKLAELSEKLTHCFAANTNQWRKSGLLIDSIDSKPCKPILDEIDRVLAQHYGFTEEELAIWLSFIIAFTAGGLLLLLSPSTNVIAAQKQNESPSESSAQQWLRNLATEESKGSLDFG